MTEPIQPREIRFRITDIYGITEAEILLRSGTLNRIEGANGAGKTSAILAILRALGDDSVALEIRDGAQLGTIDVERLDGPPDEAPEDRRSRVVVPAKGRIRTQGEPPLSPSDVRALTTLITGDHLEGDEPRARKRLDAFLRIVRPRMDEATAALLCERDPEMMAWLGERVVSGQIQDLLTAANKLKEELQRRAREKEDAATSWEGQENAHLTRATELMDRLAELGLLDPLPHPSPEEAQAGVEEKTRGLADIEREAKARAEREKLQEGIRAASTRRPDVAGAEAAARAHAGVFQEARTEVSEIDRQIAVLQERRSAAIERRDKALADGREAEARWKELQAEAAQWDQQQALLEEEVTGPTPDDVERAKAALAEARRQESIHRVSSEILEARSSADAAGKKRSREADRGKQLRAWSKAVPNRVGDVLAKQGANGFTVVDGHLAYQLNGGAAVDFDTRLSTGQQITAAFDLAGAHFHGLVYIAPEFYLSLDDEHRAGVDDFAAERPDLFLITEEATAGKLVVAHGVAREAS